MKQGEVTTLRIVLYKKSVMIKMKEIKCPSKCLRDCPSLKGLLPQSLSKRLLLNLIDPEKEHVLESVLFSI